MRSYLNVAVAVSPLSGRLTWQLSSRMKAPDMSTFLTQTCRAFPRERLVMFLDGAGWHTAHALHVPKRMQLERLPPYSPELNPVEAIWHYLRTHVTRHQVYATLDALRADLIVGLRVLERDARLVSSITAFRWVRAARCDRLT